MRQWTTMLPRKIQHGGSTYRVDVLGLERSDGTWEGRLQFSDGRGRPVTTGEETSQPNRDALEYWATGLETIYLEGALQRALDAAAREQRR